MWDRGRAEGAVHVVQVIGIPPAAPSLCFSVPKGEGMKFLNVAGPQIRKLRCARGWSQSELAVKLQLAGWDISRSSLAKIEARLVWVGDYELFYFIQVFKIGLESLFPQIDSEKRPHEALQLLLKRNRVLQIHLLQATNPKSTTTQSPRPNSDSSRSDKSHQRTARCTPTPVASI